MKRYFIPAGLILTCGLAIQACAEVREEMHKTYPLTATGRISLRNVNGFVHITAWDRDEVKLDAVKKAREQSGLDKTRIEVDPRADAIDIRTRFPENCSHDCGTVDYTLMVPRRAELSRIDTVNGAIDIEAVTGTVRANSVNGGITAKRMEGDTELQTVNGRVDFDYNRLAAHSVKASTVNGAVEAGMPADAGARLSASTVHGSITSDFGESPNKSTGFFPGHSLNTTIGSGATPVKLSTVNGSIVLRRR